VKLNHEYSEPPQPISMEGMFKQLFLCAFNFDFEEINGVSSFNIKDFWDGKSSHAITVLRILN